MIILIPGRVLPITNPSEQARLTKFRDFPPPLSLSPEQHLGQLGERQVHFQVHRATFLELTRQKRKYLPPTLLLVCTFLFGLRFGAVS